MAESIALFFRRAGWDEIADEVSRFAEEGVAHRWFYPPPPETSSVILDRDDTCGGHLLDEYEPEERARLLAALGGPPSAVLIIELRRSQGRRAVDDAASVAVRLLRRFGGLADDLAGELWTLDEIEGGAGKKRGAFLDVYRHPPPVERDEGSADPVG
jgi:hypothetical protein